MIHEHNLAAAKHNELNKYFSTLKIAEPSSYALIFQGPVKCVFIATARQLIDSENHIRQIVDYFNNSAQSFDNIDVLIFLSGVFV